MQVERLGIKLFLESGSLETDKLINVFHSWIQGQSIQDHLLIDVHNYSHVRMGPGILLVGHEGNFSWDLAQDRPGLLYTRKQSLEGDLENRLAQTFQAVLAATSRLEQETSLGALRFGTRELLILANDRLLAPNGPETFRAFRPSLQAVLEKLLGKEPFTLTHLQDPKERFAISVQTKGSIRIPRLLEKLESGEKLLA